MLVAALLPSRLTGGLTYIRSTALRATRSIRVIAANG